LEKTTSFLRPNSILHQEAVSAKGLKMMHKLYTVINTVNFIRASALTHRQLVALLTEVENEYDEIIYPTNVW
jgi:hypothetical protein